MKVQSSSSHKHPKAHHMVEHFANHGQKPNGPSLFLTSFCRPLGLLSLFFSACTLLLADEPLADAFFTQKVFPVLEENCFKCHSHASGKSKGGLLLDNLQALLEGGETGPAVTLGKPEESLLIKLVRSKESDTQMPPKGDRLSDDAISILETWIRAGAPWPKSAQSSLLPNGPAKRLSGKITDEDRSWWAFVPVKQAEIPAPAFPNTPDSPIDRFIDERLASEGLQPGPEAEKRALIRRVTLGLTGLPPSPAEIELFLADTAPDAYEKLVDRLLASPRYGERMGRVWMDLVRYADSDGYRVDDYRPTAWRYRDYIIQSFNNNKPYDQFVQEQLAGDELFPGDPQALTATGYLQMWIYEYNNRDARTQWDTILNDITDTTADVFMGLGLQCARCHDHKFDPILQKDYYALQSFFAAIYPRQDRPAATPVERETYLWKLAKWQEKTLPIHKDIAAIEGPHRARAEKEAITKFPEDIQEMIRKSPEMRTPLENQLAILAWRQVEYEWDRLERRIKGEQREKLSHLHKELAQFDSIRPAPLPAILSVTDVGSQAPATKIPKKGTEVHPSFLTVLSSEYPAPPAAIHVPEQGFSTGRRSALAMWLTNPENPLTARVMVNRLWQMHFKQGIAAFASDFGKLGEPPSHPELLDWLAGQFVKDGWDIKQTHRRIVTSAAYRRSTSHPDLEQGLKKDPTNRLLWRAQPTRLEAEQIRDSILAVTGELKEDRGGQGVPFTEPKRSVYTRIMRNGRDPLTDAFDAPLWFASASSRDVTTTPIQSLLLINSPFMLQRGKAFADRIFRTIPGNQPNASSQRIISAYQLTMGRRPSTEELFAAERFIARQQQLQSGVTTSQSHRGFVPEKIPFRDGQGAFLEPGGISGFRAKDSISISAQDGFTVEAFIVPRTVAETGALRTIIAKWNGNYSMPGWRLGVTGQKSRRTPMVLALQTVGLKQDGKISEVPFFSGLRIQMNKPYFVSAAITFATRNGPGSVTFSVKDLSNDDEPLLIDTIPCDIYGIPDNKLPVTLGSQTGPTPDSFHGTLDDVRFSTGSLPTAMLLLQSENANPATKGFWRFESKPDILADISGEGHDLEVPEDPRSQSKNDTPTTLDSRSAFAAFCHALLNSSEFLYTE